jgi:hypothetical protein
MAAGIAMTLLEPDRDQIERFVGDLFRYAGAEGFASVRAFPDNAADTKPFRIQGVPLKSGLNYLIETAMDIARRAANNPKPVVFCPPLGAFNDKNRAREQNLIAGFALTVECDEHPQEAREILEGIIGPRPSWCGQAANGRTPTGRRTTNCTCTGDCANRPAMVCCLNSRRRERLRPGL